MIPLLVLILLAAGGAVYVGDYYRADLRAVSVLEEEIPGITVMREAGRIIFRPDEVKAGLIFYPGGKVEYTAYSPLMAELAKEGFLCVLIKMPLNLAVFGSDSADSVYGDFPEVDRWILAGHSLGGVMAAFYAGKNAEKLDGLVLLASYSPDNLKDSGIKVLSIYGSKDGVLDLKDYSKNRVNLPDGASEVVISGGCHSGFGSYGPQKGDGEPSISNEEQIRITAETIADWAFGPSGKKYNLKIY